MLFLLPSAMKLIFFIEIQCIIYLNKSNVKTPLKLISNLKNTQEMGL